MRTSITRVAVAAAAALSKSADGTVIAYGRVGEPPADVAEA